MIIHQQYLMKESLCKNDVLSLKNLANTTQLLQQRITQQYKSYLMFADPSLMLAERLRLMMARDPSELAILGHLS